MLLRPFVRRRAGGFWYCWVLLALVVIPGRLRAELKPRQQEVLVGILTERYTQRWLELDTNQLSELRLKADAYLELCRRDHLRGGLLVSLRYADTNRSEVVGYEALEDSAAWTGFYLAGLTFRWAVTRDNRNLAEIRRVLDGVDLLLTASGRTGYVARFVGSASDPAYQASYRNFGGADPARPGFGRDAHRSEGGTEGKVWLGHSDRDQYAGLNLGLGIVHDVVRDAGIRARVATNVTMILQRLVEDGWKIKDGKGHETFVTPMLQAALLRSGATVAPKEYEKLYERSALHLADLIRPGELPQPAVQRYHDYRPAIFTLANLVCLARLERNNPVRRLSYQDLCAQQWREGTSHLNPWFAAGFVSVHDNTTDPLSRAVLQGVLTQYPAPPRWAGRRENYAPEQLIYIEANGRRWSKVALPFPFRDPAPFQWVASPFLPSVSAPEPVVHPGIDLVLPFWMARESGVIPAEDDDPSTLYQARRTVRPGTAAGIAPSTNRVVLPPDRRTLEKPR